MAIDTSMYNQNPMSAFTNSLDTGLRLGDMARKRNEENQIKDIYAKNTVQNPDGSMQINKQGVLSDLYKIKPEKAMELEQTFRQQDAANRKAKLDSVIQDYDFLARTTAGVKDQASWTAALESARQRGVDISKEPTQYDPNYVKGIYARALTAKEQLENQFKQQEMGFKERDTRAKEKEADAKLIEANAKRKEAGSANQGKQDQAKQTAGIVVQDLGRAMNILKNSDMSAGPVAGQTSYLPGTPSWQLQEMLDSVKANVGFDKLQAMRAASKTGAALGSVSDKETAMLQATAGKLDVRLPRAVLEDNMKRLYNQYNDVIHGPGKGPERQKLSFDEQGNPIEKKTLKTSEIEWAD